MDALHHVVRRAQAGDDHRDLAPHADIEVVIEAIVRLMDDLVDCVRRDSGGRIRGPAGFKPALDLFQPFVEHFRRPGVQRRKRTDDAAGTLSDDQIGIADDEHRRPDHRQAHGRFQFLNKGHGNSWRLDELRNLPGHASRVKHRDEALPGFPRRKHGRADRLA
jgi:hypothetical protein